MSDIQPPVVGCCYNRKRDGQTIVVTETESDGRAYAWVTYRIGTRTYRVSRTGFWKKFEDLTP